MTDLGLLLLLHGNGLDELVMVGVGLLLAYVVISVAGKNRPTDDGAEHVAVEDAEDRTRFTRSGDEP